MTTSISSAARYYSRRILNPFSGVMQLVELNQARATSMDGLNWRLQIQREIFQQPWSSLAIPVGHSGEERFFVYGVWSRNEGLARVPIHPGLYAEHVEQAIRDLLEILQGQLPILPFAPADHLECWLLDPKDQMPVALLKSDIPATAHDGTEDVDKLPFPQYLRWVPSESNATGFTTSAFASRQQNATLPINAADMLATSVRERVGKHAQAAWFRRDNEGNANLLCTNQPGRKPDYRELTSTQLPDLLITQDWQTIDERQITQDYITWMAPLLLTLNNINDHTRQQLELAAQHRSLLVARLHRLYPKIHDRQLLNKILVEATLRASSNRVGREQHE